MSQKKKVTLIITAIIVVGLSVGIFYVARGGFTAKQRYNNCAETCRELMILNSSIPFCLTECEDITGYSPSASEKEEAANRNTSTTNTSTTTNTSKTNTSTTNTSNQNTNTVSVEDYEDREYYCEWVWPQEIIDKDTSVVIYSCTSDMPWCYYADNQYANVGCCSDKEHTDCTLLPDLLNS